MSGAFFESAFPLAPGSGLFLPGGLLAALLPRCGTPPMGDASLLEVSELSDRKEPAFLGATEERGEVAREGSLDWLREGAAEVWREERLEF